MASIKNRPLEVTLTPAIGEIDCGHDGWETFIAGIERKFRDAVNDGKEKVFTTDARGLWAMFMAGIPEDRQQHYNCRACRSFIERYGGLATVNHKTGELLPIMWHGVAPAFFSKSVANLAYQVKHANITGVFVTGLAELGSHRAGGWSHMAVEVPLPMRYRDRLKSASQEAARYREDHRALLGAMSTFSMSSARTAVNILRHYPGISRADKFLPWAEWFLGIKKTDGARPRKTAENRLWLAVAEAPAGYCHIKGSVLGAMLYDIEERKSIAAIGTAHNERVDPLHYQRPKSAPSDQNVDRAEEIVAKLGLEKSLERRFARLDEVCKSWVPLAGDSVKQEGVFASLRSNKETSIVEGTKTYTWTKFAREVLPEALEMDVELNQSKRYNLCAMVTAVHKNAPPILKWDREENRNPVSWYSYAYGSLPREWGITTSLVKVTAVAPRPDGAQAAILLLRGTADPGQGRAGSALFPEILRPELYEVRKTVEAYSRKKPLQGWSRSSACGLHISAAHEEINIILRVRTRHGQGRYLIDRWD